MEHMYHRAEAKQKFHMDIDQGTTQYSLHNNMDKTKKFHISAANYETIQNARQSGDHISYFSFENHYLQIMGTTQNAR